MIKPTPNVNNGHGQPETARLSSRHLLSIEGMSPIEIRALLDRGNYFADHPTDSTSTALHGKTIVQNTLQQDTSRLCFRIYLLLCGGEVLYVVKRLVPASRQARRQLKNSK